MSNKCLLFVILRVIFEYVSENFEYSKDTPLPPVHLPNGTRTQNIVEILNDKVKPKYSGKVCPYNTSSTPDLGKNLNMTRVC